MSRLNEDLVLEYLVENLNKDLVKKYPIKTALMLDYCYKDGERIPQDWFSGFTSKVSTKSENKSSKPVSIDESNMKDCLFLESYSSMLSEPVKNLIRHARTAQDFKALISIEVLLKKTSDNNRVVNSSQSIGSKVLSLVKKYKESNANIDTSRDYNLMREYSIKVKERLKSPFRKELAEELKKSKGYLEERLRHYNRHSEEGFVPEIKEIIRETSKAIDKKFNDYISNVDQSYSKIKRTFEDNVWNNEKRVNRLIFLRSDLEDIKEKYKLALHEEGIRNCNLLDTVINDTINSYNYSKDLDEEFKSVKKRVSDYYKEIDSDFCIDISFDSMRRLNEIFSDVKRCSDKKFPVYIPCDQQEDYYSRLNKVRAYLKQKCSKRAQYVIERCSKYRQKVGSSFFSWRTKKFVNKLEKYDKELEVWSKCQAI